MRGLSSGLQQGPSGGQTQSELRLQGDQEEVRVQQDEVVKVRQSTYQDGRWLNNLSGRREWHETSSRSPTGNCIIFRSCFLWHRDVSPLFARISYNGQCGCPGDTIWDALTLLDSYTGSCGNTPCIIRGDAETSCWCWGKMVTMDTSFPRVFFVWFAHTACKECQTEHQVHLNLMKSSTGLLGAVNSPRQV